MRVFVVLGIGIGQADTVQWILFTEPQLQSPSN